MVAGKCHCKANVEGDYCGMCKHGYWQLLQDNDDGCIKCTCLTHGTVGNQGCDKDTGECRCKRYVTGDKCDQCLVRARFGQAIPLAARSFRLVDGARRLHAV